MCQFICWSTDIVCCQSCDHTTPSSARSVSSADLRIFLYAIPIVLVTLDNHTTASGVGMYFRLEGGKVNLKVTNLRYCHDSVQSTLNMCSMLLLVLLSFLLSYIIKIHLVCLFKVHMREIEFLNNKL